MANQDILYELWLDNNLSKKEVVLNEIEKFANRKKDYLKSKRGRITPSGFNYAVLKFILEYCSPFNWSEGLWEKFEKAKNPTKGNYAIWRNHLSLSVDIIDKSLSKNSNVFKSAIYSPTVREVVVSKDKFLNKDMLMFIEFIIKKIETETIQGKKGWLDQLKSYQWPPGKGDFKEGIDLRKHFNYVVKCAANSTGLGSETFRHGVCNTVAGWGGLKEVSKEDCLEIFDSISYLKSIVDKDLIDCNRIFRRRIALASKLYYFSDPLNWTIYDSRVAFALSQFVNYFKKEKMDIFDRVRGEIIFSVPPSQSGMRKHPFGVKWNETEASLWFVKASILLKAIAECLNKESFFSTQDVDSCRLYHVEMVFFRLGEQNW
ncbi:MAG: hypothetical protein KJ893_06355 [Candidatus Omnitrophica bacterium]|nr:hypothetical protein [Candidatus Omnitrophota bacterium]MCG2693248.1 hypothetical protein [Candidatus Parcubacteria bacterium]